MSIYINYNCLVNNYHPRNYFWTSWVSSATGTKLTTGLQPLHYPGLKVVKSSSPSWWCEQDMAVLILAFKFMFSKTMVWKFYYLFLFKRKATSLRKTYFGLIIILLIDFTCQIDNLYCRRRRRNLLWSYKKEKHTHKKNQLSVTNSNKKQILKGQPIKFKDKLVYAFKKL